MKHLLSLFLSAALVFSLTSCSQEETPPQAVQPSIEQMRNICELAVMECYYHNVAKYYEENAGGFLSLKDKHFWIEYDGTVSMGVDASRVTMEIQDSKIVITLPPVQVLGKDVNPDSLNYIVAKGSAKITAADEVYALDEAQLHLEQTASQDTTMLGKAQTQVEQLLRNYVKTVLEPSGQAYSLAFEYLPADPAPTSTPESSPAP